MKSLFFYLTVFLSISSCSENSSKEATPGDLKNSDSLQIKDTISNPEKLSSESDTTTTYIFPPQDSIISEGTPKVTSLPFSVKGYYYITDLVKRNPNIYRLPSIEKLEYFPMFIYCEKGDCIADLKKPAMCPDGGSVVDTSIFKFKKYRFKLPNIHNFETYIVCDTLYWNYGVPIKMKNGNQVTKCSQVYFHKHCYLLIYDSLSRAAKIIALHHPSTSTIDNPQARTFTIDKNFVIHLQDYAIDYGSDGLGQDFAPLNFTYDIKILPDGNLEVKKSIKNK